MTTCNKLRSILFAAFDGAIGLECKGQVEEVVFSAQRGVDPRHQSRKVHLWKNKKHQVKKKKKKKLDNFPKFYQHDLRGLSDT
jgi:hypothetical protein